MCNPQDVGEDCKKNTYQLELHRHQTKVDNLNGWPHNEVGLESRNIHIPQLVRDCPSTTTLSDSHGGEEDTDTKRSKDELVECNTLHGRAECAGLGDGEDALEELEPPELHGRHAETVGHETSEALEIEGRGKVLVIGNQVSLEKGILLVKLVDLDGEVVALRDAAGLAHCPLTDGCDGLRDGVGDATEDGIRHHHGHDRTFIVIRVEPRRQTSSESHFDEENDGVQERLRKGLSVGRDAIACMF
jgi:hypothetical protein